jgi:2-amino-4-hydroxy-6-hydroxymethyldihydropteridine diphosphokinase
MLLTNSRRFCGIFKHVVEVEQHHLGRSTMVHTVYLALGTNLGDRESNLEAALDALSSQIRLLAESPIYQTAPWGYEDQPDFLNQVIRAETTLSPRELLTFVKRVEEQVGREPSFRYGPRKIDVDILFYEDWIVEEDDLIIPHPRLHQRAFVLVPLADLAPELCHPKLKRTVSDLLEDVDTGEVKRLQTSDH